MLKGRSWFPKTSDKKPPTEGDENDVRKKTTIRNEEDYVVGKKPRSTFKRGRSSSKKLYQTKPTPNYYPKTTLRENKLKITVRYYLTTKLTLNYGVPLNVTYVT